MNNDQRSNFQSLTDSQWNQRMDMQKRILRETERSNHDMLQKSSHPKTFAKAAYQTQQMIECNH